jgi:hypothetical protein
MNRVGPAWLRMENGRWAVIEKRAAVVRRIFQLCIDGHGLHSITQVLNQGKVPVIAKATVWQFSYICKILKNRAVLGEFQPHVFRDGKRHQVGDLIPDYYPAVVSEADFYRAQAALTARKNHRGARGKYVRNLFTGLLRDARDGCTLVTKTEADKCGTLKLVSSGGHRGLAGSTYGTFPYELVEHAFLRFCKELKASEILPRKGPNPQDQIVALEGRLQNVQERMTKLQTNLKDAGEFEAGLRLLRDLEKDKQELQTQLEKARASATVPEARSLDETQDLIALLEKAEEEDKLNLRIKLKQSIRQLVTELWMYVAENTGGVQLALIQVHFRTGPVRHLILVRLTAGPLRGGWYVTSKLHPVGPGGTPYLRKYRTDSRTNTRLQRLLDEFTKRVHEANLMERLPPNHV